MRGMPQFQQYPMNKPIPAGEPPLYVGIHGGGGNVQSHYHPFAELTYVRSGGGYKTVNGVTHRMKPGTACFYLPNHVHESAHDPERPPQVYCCMFDLELIDRAALDSACLELLSRIGGSLPSYVYMEGEEADRFESALARLRDEYGRRPETLGRNGLLRSLLTEALLLFLREMAAAERASDRHGSPDAAAAAFWPALRYVHVHFAEPLSLGLVAAAAGVSEPVVSRMFREHTGTSFLPYLHRLRVESAAHMLASTDRPVSDVALAAGFESFRSFSRVFGRMKGMTPSAYRSEHRKAIPDGSI
ncbi:AraC family transcriptional regulator [Paenibacillus sp. GYB003]|uniref:AraC family transcriptional regulator n=1 Tax=Paenibacillus sp. GYB003 TaxID=2994392 RepID=UPI002F96C0F8